MSSTVLLLADVEGSNNPGQPPTAKQEARLEQLRARIRALKAQLDETVDKRDAHRVERRELESQIGKLISNLRQLGTRLESQTDELRGLERRRTRAQANLRSQKAGLEQQVRAVYAMGRQGYAKMLLNQDDPAAVSRILVYYRYLNQERLAQIGRIKSALVTLRTVEHDIHTQRRELETLRAAQLERKRRLQAKRARRAEVLALLERQVDDQTAEITRLRQDEQRLERLLDQLQDYLADVPRTPGQATRFQDHKGKLPLPAHGRVLARFGTAKNSGRLRWKGVFLSGRLGQDVISVARGRVAFADWLRGFGLLLILEHGDGYMTLYGHNQSLYAQVGDWVEAGQVIASMGNTGDARQPGVYFEIRKKGHPQDPLKWCRLP
ncbi:MAG: murein hydrolase activator EnvC family protein [Acidiferrobacterales bacterium]